MSDDLLERATRALRESSEAPNLRAGATRARLLASAERKYAPRRRSWLSWSLIVATLFASGTAMAARLGGGLPELWRAVAPAAWVEPERGRASKSKPSGRRAVSPPAPESSERPAVVAAPEPTPAVAADGIANGSVPIQSTAAEQGPQRSSKVANEGRARNRRHAPSRAPARRPPAVESAAATTLEGDEPEAEPERAEPVAVAAPSAVAPVASQQRADTESAQTRQSPASAEANATRSTLTLFRRAERLHRRRDPRALAAWDAYLAVAPSGALAPEARYNRALTLVRLRELDAARSALREFADGRADGYRKDEARALLRSLDR